MTAEVKHVDLFCRVNVQSTLPHDDIVSTIAERIGGVRQLNSITTDTLDISVDDNDVFHAEKARIGADRWLYFPYTLAIDPVAGVAPAVYIGAIGDLLQSLWSSGMDAVAASDFEEQLPRNVNRLTWARTPPCDGNAAGVKISGDARLNGEQR